MPDINALQHTDEQVRNALLQVANEDVTGLIEARRNYGESWKQEGGFSAYFNIKRKIDRLVRLCSRAPEVINNRPTSETPVVRERFDIFSQIMSDLIQGGEGTLDAIRDLRRYCALVEADMILRGVNLPLQRDTAAAKRRAAVPDGTGQSNVRGHVDG